MGTGFAFDLERCTECRRCMIACSIVKEGRVLLPRSRIAIGSRWPELPEIRVCRFDDCPGKPCLAACPAAAISDKGGMVLIDADACTGCGACVDACPKKCLKMEIAYSGPETKKSSETHDIPEQPKVSPCEK